MNKEPPPFIKWSISQHDWEPCMNYPPAPPPSPVSSDTTHETYYIGNPVFLNDSTPYTFEGLMGRPFHNESGETLHHVRFKGPISPFQLHPNKLILTLHLEKEDKQTQDPSCSHIWCNLRRCCGRCLEMRGNGSC